MVTNTLEADTMVNSMTSSDFLAADVQAALATANAYCEAVAGETITKSGSDWSDYVITDSGQSMAVVLLAVAILHEGRRAIKSRTEDIEIRTVDKLFTDEMRNMLLKAEEANVAFVKFLDIYPSSSDDWVR